MYTQVVYPAQVHLPGTLLCSTVRLSVLWVLTVSTVTRKRRLSKRKPEKPG